MCYLGGKLQITEPKTKSSIRTVILPPALLEVLKAYRQTVDSRWMFPSPAKANAPLTQNYVRRRMQQTLERAGCKVVRFHDLRHPYVKHTTKNFSCKSRNPKPSNVMVWDFCFDYKFLDALVHLNSSS